jgi:hypothetical protein
MRAYLAVGLLVLAVGCARRSSYKDEAIPEDTEEGKKADVAFVVLGDDDERLVPEETRLLTLSGGQLYVEDDEKEADDDLLAFTLYASETEKGGVTVWLIWSAPVRDPDELERAKQRIRKAADPRVRTLVYVQHYDPTRELRQPDPPGGTDRGP